MNTRGWFRIFSLFLRDEALDKFFIAGDLIFRDPHGRELSEQASPLRIVRIDVARFRTVLLIVPYVASLNHRVRLWSTDILLLDFSEKTLHPRPHFTESGLGACDFLLPRFYLGVEITSFMLVCKAESSDAF